MTENNAPTSNTLHLKARKKPLTEGKQRHAPKEQRAEPKEAPPPPKKPKDFRLQYKGKEGTPVAESHKEWKHLDAFYKLDQAQAAARSKMNGNTLTKMFDYRILDKDNKEQPL